MNARQGGACWSRLTVEGVAILADFIALLDKIDMENGVTETARRKAQAAEGAGDSRK